MAWCRQATSHYLSQCWPRSLSSYGITRPQWVNCVVLSFNCYWYKLNHVHYPSQDEGMRKVPVKSDPAVYIKTMVISDSQDKIQVSLWRDMAHEPFSVGQQVRLTNMLVNVYKDVVSLNSSKDPTVTVSKWNHINARWFVTVGKTAILIILVLVYIILYGSCYEQLFPFKSSHWHHVIACCLTVASHYME